MHTMHTTHMMHRVAHETSDMMYEQPQMLKAELCTVHPYDMPGDQTRIVGQVAGSSTDV